MTPYVSLQVDLIRAFRRLLEHDHVKLAALAQKYCISGQTTLDAADFTLLERAGSCTFVADEPRQPWREDAILKTIIEQLDLSRGLQNIQIRNQLGSPFVAISPMDYTTYLSHQGDGSNVLRTPLVCQPRALQVGDFLATGEKVISQPREGGDGAVLIHVSECEHDTWLSFPARTPIALLAAVR